MLVIGFNAEKNTHTIKDLDIDLCTDPPDRIYKALKSSSKGEEFTIIVCVENDTEVASFLANEDFDPEDTEDEEEPIDDEELDDDDLHEDDEDFDDE